MVNLSKTKEFSSGKEMNKLTEECGMGQGGDSKRRVVLKCSLGSTFICIIATVLAGLLLLCQTAAATVGGEIVWETGDGQLGKQEAAATVIDSGGNVIITGTSTAVGGGEDFYTVKVSSSGTIIWQKIFDLGRDGFEPDEPSENDRSVAIAVDSSDNIIVTGYGSVDGNVNIIAMKYSSSDGSELWPAPYIYDGSINGIDHPTTVTVDSDDNIYIGGYTQAAPSNKDDFLIIKLLPDATVVRELSFDGGADLDDRVINIVADNDTPGIAGDDYLLMTGYSRIDHSGREDFDIVTMKFNAGGVEQWTELYDGGVGDDRGQFISVDSLHNVVTLAYTTGSGKEILTLKYSGSAGGAPLWQYSYGAGAQNIPHGLLVDSADDVFVTGSTFTNTGLEDFYTARYAGTDGQVSWEVIYDSDGIEKNDIPMFIVADDKDGIFVTGYCEDLQSSDKDFLTVKYNKENGHLLWHDILDGPSGGTQQAVGAAIGTGDGHVIVSGWSGVETEYASGIASFASGNTLTLIDTTQTTWEVDKWKGFFLNMLSGGNSGESIRILSNTLDTLSLDSVLSSPVQAGDLYSISDRHNYDYYAIKYDFGELNSPSWLSAAAISETQVDLIWQDNSATVNEEQFCIDRCSGIGCSDFSEMTCVGQNEVSYSDIGLIPHARYSYKIRSKRNSVDYSNYSDIITVLTTVFNPLSPSWRYLYNGPDNMSDVANSVAVGPDNEPIVTGSSVSTAGGYDYYTAKINRDTAVELWSHRYNDPDDQMDVATCVTVDDANNYVVSGYSTLYGGSGSNTNDFFTFKYGPDGPDIYSPNPPTYGALWTDKYSGPGGGDDRSEAVATTTDGSSILVVGYGRNQSGNDDIYLVKYLGDVSGTRAWDAVPYDGGYYDYPRGISLDGSGDVLVGGTTFNGNDYDQFLRKYLSADGSESWTIINGSTYGDDEINAVVTDSAGNVYVVGYVTNEALNLDMYIEKYDSSGSSLWTKLVGGAGIGYDEAIGIVYDAALDEIIIAGNITSLTGSIDFHLRRYTSGGMLIWERTLDTVSADDYVVAMVRDADGDICLAGDTDNGSNTDILAACYDKDGFITGSTLYNGAGDGDDTVSSIAVNAFGEVFVAGTTFNAAGNNDYILFKVETNTLLTPDSLSSSARYTTVELNWADNAVGEDSYKIWRKDAECATGGDFVFIDSVAADSENYTDTGLTNESAYCYRIQAFKGGITSEPLETDAQTITPVAPGCAAVAVSTGEVGLSWSDTTDGEEGVELLRCLGTDCTITNPDDIIATPLLGTETYVDTSVCQGGIYTYRVRFFNNAENWQVESDCLNVSPVKVLPLTNVSAISPSEGEVIVSWSDPNFDSEGYSISRCEGVGCTPVTSIATPALDSFAPVVDLKMNDNSWADSSRNNNNAAPLNGASFVSPGFLGGGSGDFDGVDDRAEWSYSGSWPTNDFTMAAWFKTDVAHVVDPQSTSTTTGTSGQNYLFGAQFRSSPDSGAGVSVGTNGISVYEHSSGYMPPLAVYSGVVGNGWNHVTVTYTAKKVRIYLNGSLVRNGYSSPKTTIYAPFQLGGGAYGNFTGQVDDVKIFDYALDAAEISTLAQTGYYSDTNVVPNQSYTYRVTASNNSVACPWVSGPADSTIVPSVANPCPLTATVINSTTVDLAWADNFSYETGYEIERCEGVACLSSCTVGSSCNVTTRGANNTSYTVNSVCPDTEFYYQIRAYKSSAWDTVCSTTATTPLPTIPTNLSAVRYSEQEVSLTWDDANSDESSFSVERCEVGVDCPSFSVVGSASAAAGQGSYIDQGLSVDHSYRYRVKAVKNGACGWPTGYSNDSNDVTATITAPSDLNVSAISSTDVNLSWINGTSWESNFSIGRCEVGTDCPNFTEIDNTVPPGVSFYTDKSACSGITYQYQVTAVNAGWPANQTSAPSPEVTTFVNQAPFNLTLTATSESEVMVNWLDTNPDESGFTVERCDDNATNCTSGPFVPVGSSMPTPPNLLDAPVDYSFLYKMDESAWVENSTDIIDGSGGGHTAQSRNGANTVASSISGRAANFDGYNDYVYMQTPIILSRFGSTLSWWQKSDTTLDTGLFSSQSYSATISMIDSRSTEIYGETNNNCNYITFPGVAKNTKWTMYTIVFDNEHSYLYIDGELFGETPDYGLNNCNTSAPATKLLADLSLHYIGSRNNYSTRYFDGQMDELAVYDRALSEDEVAARFNSLVMKFAFHFEKGGWDGIAGDVFDSSGQGNNGTSYGGATTVTKGAHLNAAYFDGVDDYINLGDVDELDAPSAMSFSLWFNRTADLADATGHGINNVLVSQSDDVTNDNLEIGTQGSVIEIYLDSASGSDPVKSVEAGIVNDTWYHLALTYDKDVTNPLKLYLNGALLGEWSEFSGAVASSTTSPLTLGIARPGGSAFPESPFNGYLDEVSAYGYALSGAEINTLYNGAYHDINLLPMKAYTYRVKADKNSTCAWLPEYSLPVEVTTLSPPPPTNLVATPVNTTRIDLNWTDNTGSESAFKVLRCLDTGGGCIPVEIAQLPADTESFADTTLCTPGNYTYSVAAIVSGVDVVNSPAPVVSAPLLPAAPTGLAITSPTEVEADLNWLDNMTEEYGYKIDRCEGTGCTPVPADNIGETNYEFIDDFSTGIDPATWNQSAYSQTVSSATPPINISDSYGTAMITDSNGSVELIQTSTGIGSNAVYSSVNLTYKNPAILGNGDFNVQIDYDLPDGDLAPSYLENTIDLRLIIYMGDDYFFVDRNRNSGVSSYRGISRVGGVSQSGTLVTTETSGKLRLARIGKTLSCYAWTGGAWYTLHTRQISPGVTPTALYLNQYAERNEAVTLRTVIDNFTYSSYSSTVSQPYNFADNTLIPNTTYVYKVYPYKGSCLMEGFSQTAEITPQVTCPTDLIATSYNTTEVELGWSDTTSSESSFEIERCDGICDETGSFSKIGETFADQNSYLDQTATQSSSLSYRVKVNNSTGGWSCYSNILSGTILSPVIPTNVTATRASEARIELTWDDTNVDESKYVIERGDEACTNFTELVQVGAGVTTFSDTTVLHSNTYCYVVKACKDDLDPGASDNSWCTLFSSQSSASTSVNSPDPLTANPINTSTTSLSWNDDAELETGFVIERCLGIGCSTFTEIASSPVPANLTSFTDNGVCPASTYRYQVKAEKLGNWSSLFTSPAEVTTQTPQKIQDFVAIETVDDFDGREVTVSWSDINTDEDGFNLERCEGVGCIDFTPLTTITSMEDIKEGVDPAYWEQWGGLEALSSTTVPIDISDATGTVRISEVSDGVEFAMTGSGAGSSFWNNANLHMLTPADLGAGNFDLQVDYDLPDGEITVAVNHVYLRLTISFPDPDGSDPLLGDYFFIQHMATPSGGIYKAKMQINNVVDNGIMATTDTSGKLRITRTNDVIKAYAWTGGSWQQIGPVSPIVTTELAPSYVHFGSILVPSDAVSIRTVVSDFRASNIHIDDTVSPSTTYCYRIHPSKTATCSWDPAVGVDDLYSEICTETAPAAPSLLTATVNGMAITLDWQDNSSDESGFEILKRLDNGNFVTIDTVGPDIVTYTDSLAINPDMYYTYKVKSLRGVNTSGSVEVTTTDPTVWQAPVCLP